MSRLEYILLVFPAGRLREGRKIRSVISPLAYYSEGNIAGFVERRTMRPKEPLLQTSLFLHLKFIGRNSCDSWTNIKISRCGGSYSNIWISWTHKYFNELFSLVGNGTHSNLYEMD